jgi:MoaA/NifB/PqqE/SkfB family radical SAM enzyme
MDCWLLTSGFGFTREKAASLHQAGLMGAQISLDHWEEDKHNAFRNNGKSFALLKEAVKNCLENEIMVSLSLCATRDFVTEENLMKYAITAKNMGAHFIRILEPRAIGKFSQHDVRLDQKQVELLSEFSIMMNNNPRFRDFPVIAFFGYHQRKLGCFGAGNRYLYVDPNGDVHACPFCRGKMGNLLEEPFGKIIEKVRLTGCHEFKIMNK